MANDHVAADGMDAAVVSYAQKLAAWGATLPEDEAALLWTMVQRAAAAGEPDVQGYYQGFGSQPAAMFSLNFASVGFQQNVFDAVRREAAPAAPRGGGRGSDVPA